MRIGDRVHFLAGVAWDEPSEWIPGVVQAFVNGGGIEIRTDHDPQLLLRRRPEHVRELPPARAASDSFAARMRARRAG